MDLKKLQKKISRTPINLEKVTTRKHKPIIIVETVTKWYVLGKILDIFLIIILWGWLRLTSMFKIMSNGFPYFLGGDSYYYAQLLNNWGLSNQLIIIINVALYCLLCYNLFYIFHWINKNTQLSILAVGIIVNFPIFLQRIHPLFIDTDIIILLFFVYLLKLLYFCDVTKIEGVFNLGFVIFFGIITMTYWKAGYIFFLIIIISFLVFKLIKTKYIYSLYCIIATCLIFFILLSKKLIIEYLAIRKYVAEYNHFDKILTLFFISVIMISFIKLDHRINKLAYWNIWILMVMFQIITLLFYRMAVFSIILSVIILVAQCISLNGSTGKGYLLFVFCFFVFILGNMAIQNIQPEYTFCEYDIIKNTDDRVILALWDNGHFINYAKGQNLAVMKAHPEIDKIKLFLNGVYGHIGDSDKIFRQLSNNQSYYIFFSNQDNIKSFMAYSHLIDNISQDNILSNREGKYETIKRICCQDLEKKKSFCRYEQK